MGNHGRSMGHLRCCLHGLRVWPGLLALVVMTACGQQSGAGGTDASAVADTDEHPGDVAQPSDQTADSGSEVAGTDAITIEIMEDIVPDVLDTTDGTDLDALSDGSDGAGDVADIADVDAGSDAVSDAVDTGPDVPFAGCEFPADPTAGVAGAACTGDGDCASGVCAAAPDGKRCAPACVGSCCPTGWTCDKTTATHICRPQWTALCAPCTTDEQCAALTPGGLCIKHAAQGYFCATPCSYTTDCPTDYKCSYSYGTSGQNKVCVTPGTCDCNPAAIAVAAKTTCYNSNSAGICKGERSCTASGLEPCSAQIPAPETCNGIDDDCNGQTDEGMPDFDKDGIPDCDDPDMDGDGSLNADDCAPMDPQVFPGNSEKCNGFDDNCNGLTDEGFKDTDGDGIADCVDLDLDGDGVPNLVDCSPTDGGVFQGNPEICDGKDQNCNGKTDEGFPDEDKDGIADCVDPDIDGDGVNNALDCSPTDAKIFPGQKEVCDGIDQNCNGLTDEGFPDTDKDGLADCIDPDIDGDGVANALDCSPTNAAIFPGAVEVCNGVDDNCDGLTDPGCDDDKDGYCDAALPVDPTSVACPNGGGDCDDTHATVHPSAPEICDGLDNDCDGITDPGCDKDGDGYCVGVAVVSASCPSGGGDCNDDDPLTHPGASETCDNHDQNCDGTTDEGCDADGDGYCVSTVPAHSKFPACPKGAGDCNDNDKAIHPGASDVCNGIDDDCDGVTDPGCDSDGDGYCGGSVGVSAGCVNGGGDCDDSNAAIHPDAQEFCDGIDNNCVNGVDDGCDVDGDHWCVTGAVVVGSPAVCQNGINDCNDKNASVYPGAPDLCDGLANACDGKVDINCDQDGDGWCDANRVTVGAPWVCLWGGGDCDDHHATVHPNLPEVCDLLDNNCDGLTDVGCDVDGDGYCTADVVIVAGSGACPMGGTDCNDTNAAIHPGHAEFCDDLDNDCNKATDEGCDDDGDGWCDAGMTIVGTPKICPKGNGDCVDTNAAIAPGHVEWCDDVDNNCDGSTDPGCDKDGDGFCDATLITIGSPSVCPGGSGDCNDADASIKPGATEVCDDKDNNCINGTDEGCNVDGDSYCNTAMAVVGSPAICPAGGGDCDDTLQQVNPGMKEMCDDLDNNCNSVTDEGCDDDNDSYCDGMMVTVGYPKICPFGGGDCNDMDPMIHASSTGSCFEICDGIDNNHDGNTDENCDKDGDKYCDATITTVGTPGVCPFGGGDCSDSNAAVNPGAKESCATSYDDNCDGLTDSDGAVGCTNYYYDNDNDGYGGAKVCYCNMPKPKLIYVSAKVDATKSQQVSVIGSDTSGVAFANNCAAGYVAVGLNGEYSVSSFYMVTFTLMCKKLNSDGTLGASGYAPQSGVGSGPTFAGTCPNNELLTTEWGDANGADPQHMFLSRLGGHCSTISRIANQYSGWDDAIPGSPLLFNAGGTGATERLCPVSYVVTGSYGHYSTWHGDFGFVCSPVTLGTAYQMFVSVPGDCNDNNPSINPGLAEMCDNIDNNCDGMIDENCDVDKDGYCTTAKVVIGTPLICPKGAGDCNDTVAAIHPGVTDICDGIDNDCNSSTDPGCDDDGDGWCDANIVTVGKPFTCPQGAGDCNDTVSTIHPYAVEACDDVDQDCDKVIDNGCDDDSDGYCDANLGYSGAPKVCNKGKGDCDDTKAAINPGATEICDNVDNNCNGKVDETCDDDGDGWCRLTATYAAGVTVTLCTKGKTDCNDNCATCYPGAQERCDGLDNACSGTVDLGCDKDGDKYCNSSMPFDNNTSCSKGKGDCNDNNAAVNPGAIDICGNGIDDDCSGPAALTAASVSAGTALAVNDNYTSSSWLAFAFAPSVTGTLTSLNALQLLRWNSPNVSTTLRIYNGVPGAGGTQLGASTQTVSSLNNWASYNFLFGSGITVTKGATYYAVLLAADSNNGYMFTNQNTSGAWISTNGGTTWKSSGGTYPYTAIVTVSGIDGPFCQ